MNDEKQEVDGVGGMRTDDADVVAVCGSDGGPPPTSDEQGPTKSVQFNNQSVQSSCEHIDVNALQSVTTSIAITQKSFDVQSSQIMVKSEHSYDSQCGITGTAVSTSQIGLPFKQRETLDLGDGKEHLVHLLPEGGGTQDGDVPQRGAPSLTSLPGSDPKTFDACISSHPSVTEARQGFSSVSRPTETIKGEVIESQYPEKYLPVSGVAGPGSRHDHDYGQTLAYDAVINTLSQGVTASSQNILSGTSGTGTHFSYPVTHNLMISSSKSDLQVANERTNISAGFSHDSQVSDREPGEANSSSTSLETLDSSLSHSSGSSVEETEQLTPGLGSYFPQTSGPMDCYPSYDAMFHNQNTRDEIPLSYNFENVSTMDHSYYAALQDKAAPLYVEQHDLSCSDYQDKPSCNDYPLTNNTSYQGAKHSIPSMASLLSCSLDSQTSNSDVGVNFTLSDSNILPENLTMQGLDCQTFANTVSDLTCHSSRPHLPGSSIPDSSNLYPPYSGYDATFSNYPYSSVAASGGQGHSYQQLGATTNLRDDMYPENITSSADTGLEKENYAQLVLAGLATSTILPSENPKDGETLDSKFLQPYNTPKIENMNNFPDNSASYGQFSGMSSSGQRTSLPQIGTLVTSKPAKGDALFLHLNPDTIQQTVLPQISTFTESEKSFLTNDGSAKQQLKEYLRSTLPTRVTDTKSTSVKSNLELPSVRSQKPCLEVQSYTCSAANLSAYVDRTISKDSEISKSRTLIGREQSKNFGKNSGVFADASVSVVGERLTKSAEVTSQPRSAIARKSVAPAAAAGSEAQLRNAGTSTGSRERKNCGLKTSFSTSAGRGDAGLRQSKRGKAGGAARELENKKTDVVTCDADSTQHGDPPESKVHLGSVSQATREKHARGFYVHLPSKLQILKPTPEDSNQISSTVCVSPAFGAMEVDGEDGDAPPGVYGMLGMPNTAATGSSSHAVAKQPVGSSHTPSSAALPEISDAAPSLPRRSEAAAGIPETLDAAYPSAIAEKTPAGTRSECRPFETSGPSTSSDYVDPILEVPSEKKAETGEWDKLNGSPRRKRKSQAKNEDANLPKTQPVTASDGRASDATAKDDNDPVEEGKLPVTVPPPKKRGRPPKICRPGAAKSVDDGQELPCGPDVLPDEAGQEFGQKVQKTKRKVGRPKKNDKVLCAGEDTSVDHQRTLRKRGLDCGSAGKTGCLKNVESSGVADLQQREGPIITRVVDAVDSDTVGSKSRKRKLSDGDHEVAGVDKAAGGSEEVVGSKFRKRKFNVGDHEVSCVEKEAARGIEEVGGSKLWKQQMLESDVLNVEDLPQIQKKFPRKRTPERSTQVVSVGEVHRQGVGNRDSVDCDDRVETFQSPTAMDLSRKRSGDFVMKSPGPRQENVESLGQHVGDVSEVNTRQSRRLSRKKDATLENDVTNEVQPGGEVDQKKRGRPKGAKNRTVQSQVDVVIPDSELPDWVVKKSTREGKYNTYNYQQKEEVLKLAEKYGGSTLANRLGIPVSTIACWKRTFKKDTKRDPKTGRKLGSGRKLCYGDDVDELILQWILECRDLHCPITVDDIGNYAGKIVRRVEGCESFKASPGWVAKFRKRHVAMLNSRTAISQKLPPKLEDLVSQFQTQVNEIRQEYTIDPSLIINMDEVPLYFDLTGKKQSGDSGKPGVKQEVVVRVTVGRKQHLTLVGAVTAAGKGLKPMLVLKGKSEPDIKVPPHCIIEVTEKGNVDQSVLVNWVQRVLLPYTHGRPCLLLIDSYEPHRVEFVMQLFSKYNVIVAVIPEGCNSKLQPMAISVCKVFQSRLQETWLHAASEAVSKLANSPIAHLTNDESESMVQWTVDGWDKVWCDNAELIKKSFKVCGISNAIDGSEANLIRDDSYLDVVSLCRDQKHDQTFGFWY